MTSRVHSSTHVSRRVLVGASIAGTIASAHLLNSLAQDLTPMAGMDHEMPPGAVGLTSKVLARVEAPVAPGHELQLVRVEVASGATASAHTHPGVIALCLESGSPIFGVAEGTVLLTHTDSAATPEATESLTAGSEVQLQPGDCLTFDATQTFHTLRNPDEPAVIWQAHLYAIGEPPTTFLATPVP